jgi:hypothetical protein
MIKGKTMGAPGCDDAPQVTIALGDVAKPFTLIMPYYENPQFLREQFERWGTFDETIRAHMRVIIVDDCSQKFPASELLLAHKPPVPLRLFRIETDVRWNWLAARNIGAHHAEEGWLLITDMDHVLPPGTAELLIRGQHDAETIYRFQRREWSGQQIHPHPNSWFYTRAMYWKIGGHDEALSGHYGTDGEYRRRCVKTAPIRIMDGVLERHEFRGDSSTTTYLRKQPEDAGAKMKIYGRSKTWKPKKLSFPYHEVTL